MNNKETKELAESMGVSVSDLMCFSRLTANGIEEDNITDAFLSSDDRDDSVRNDIAIAYAQHAVKKMDRFVMKLKTNDEAASLFKAKVLDDLQEKITIKSVIERTEKYLNGEK